MDLPTPDLRMKPDIRYFFFIYFFLISCQNDYQEPMVSFDDYQIADGFELKLAASEPLIEAPVMLDFDNKGRMWVLEMRGFMPNVQGAGEELPNGRITILEDLDDDGVADHAKVFLDSLVLPRAIAHVYGGLLYAEPPNLWFVEINNDKPGKKTLVDSVYAYAGNPEHMPNGLLMNIDNWIYNANSHFRYQLKDGNWIKEPTTYRGQWGITKDNWGRLYYNNNTTQLIGDYVLPNTMIRNPYLKPKEGVNIKLLEDQNVFPLHATIVNRGYDKGILDENGKLVNFTAACGPLVYRGGHFPDSFQQNAFVCEPMGNLIKRNVLFFGQIVTTAKQAYENEEFIASTDEAFRPVKVLDGPDGAMYVVDMHRGVLQHRADITPYYEENVIRTGLDSIKGMGRILKVKYKDRELKKIVELEKASGSQLVELLKSDNGWLRDRAQQILIYKGHKSAVPQLKKLALAVDNEVTTIHALHALGGLNELSFDILNEVVSRGTPMVKAHGLLLLEQFASPGNVNEMENLARNLLDMREAVADLYLALSIGPWVDLSSGIFLPMLLTISDRYPEKAIYQEAIVSGLESFEDLSAFAKEAGKENVNVLLKDLLANTMHNKEEGIKNSIFVRVTIPEQGRKKGFTMFRNVCASCHGHGSEGIENLAPPLKGSEYVTGSVDRLALIILKGMEGPVHVNGRLYDLNAAMPAFENNLTDDEIADIISYLRNAFVIKPQFMASEIDAKKIARLREMYEGTLTEKRLAKMFGSQSSSNAQTK